MFAGSWLQKETSFVKPSPKKKMVDCKILIQAQSKENFRIWFTPFFLQNWIESYWLLPPPCPDKIKRNFLLETTFVRESNFWRKIYMNCVHTERPGYRQLAPWEQRSFKEERNKLIFDSVIKWISQKYALKFSENAKFTLQFQAFTNMPVVSFL